MAKILKYNTKLKPKKKADLRVAQKPDIKTTKYSDINLKKWKEYAHVITNSLWLFPSRLKKGIGPALCTHRIPLDPSCTPSRYPQRRLNNAMREVVKKEVLKGKKNRRPRVHAWMDFG